MISSLNIRIAESPLLWDLVGLLDSFGDMIQNSYMHRFQQHVFEFKPQGQINGASRRDG